MAAPLAFDDRGEGEALVLLHAFPFDRRFWDDITPPLVASGFRVIAPDLRGFGASSADDDTWTILDQAHDVAALLTHLRVMNAHVLGLSMGGYVALALVAEHPQLVRSLVLAHTKAAPDSAGAREGRAAAIATVKSAGVAAFADGMVTKLVSASAGGAVRGHVRSLMDQPPATVLAALAALRDRPDRRPLLPMIVQRTLVLSGEHDVISTPTENLDMAAQLPHGRYVEIAGVGHLSNLEAPDAFVREVANFLKG